MGKRRNGRANRAQVACLVFIALLALLSCGREPGRSAAAAAPSQTTPPAVPTPPPVDRALDDRFAFIAGLPPASPSYLSWQEEPSWKDFAGRIGEAWADFDSSILEPLRIWAGKDLGEAREKTTTLFYPFGGPDFVTASALFPDAATMVLIGLEPVGNLPDFARSSAKERGDFFNDLGALTSGFLKHGYFITMHMLDTYSLGHVDGALPVIGFFLKRGGYSVVDVRRLAPDQKGEWKNVPYAPLMKRPRRPYGVRIDCLPPGGSSLRSVYYFLCDVENPTFPPGSPLFRFFEGLGNLTTFVKAGSYLLHYETFSNLRGFILDRSLFVLQDDTAVPYRYFKRGGWEVTLFGKYTTPVKDFSNVEQKDLREAYEDPLENVQPLPFHFGYRWRSQIENLLLAKRPSRAYKVPVAR